MSNVDVEVAENEERDTEQFGDQIEGWKNDKKTGKKVFRIQAQQFLLTYPKQSNKQVPDTIDTEEDRQDGKPRGHHRRILEFFTKLAKKIYKTVLFYSIGWEPHDPKKPNYDPQRPFHWHIYIKFSSSVNVTQVRYFDIPFLADYDGSAVHPNIQSVKKGEKDTISSVSTTLARGTARNCHNQGILGSYLISLI